MLKQATQILKQYYGYESFRPLQGEIITSVLDNNDTLVLMPTGGGKSICFQIPALILDGLCVVVSPLISLMKDQVDALRLNGISASYMNSSQSAEEEHSVIDKCLNGEIKLLYVSPERLLSGFSMLGDFNIKLFAIDEAHCISSWGHDFRPEYTQLSLIKQRFPDVPIIALTATADKVTRKDIVKQLSLNNPNIFVASFDRPNLNLEVKVGMNMKDKDTDIIRFISKHQDEAGIIYCLSRKITEQLSEKLTSAGISALHYHAGMPPDERNRVQDAFIKDKVQVICATVAFGMGIDKSNVRWVIHYNLPKNIEGYYQEIGRAGRDGMNSDTVLYYNYGDIAMLRAFAEEGKQRELNIEKLQRMQQYAEADHCRRKILINYFGEHVEHNCGNCDVCRNPREHFNGTQLVQKALSALQRINEPIGMNMLIDILRGSHRAELLTKGFDKIKTYGVGAEISQNHWVQYIMQMMNLGLVEMIYDDGFSLKPTEAGKDVLFGRKEALLISPPKIEVKAKKLDTETTKRIPKQSLEDILWDTLRRLRMELADRADVPAYAVFSDKTLKEIVIEKPRTAQNMMMISGIGQAKFDKYGEIFLDKINSILKAETKTKIDTFLETLKLLKEGKSPEDIAQIRDLSPTTIYSHVAALYLKGDISEIFLYVDNQDITRVQDASISLGKSNKLKDIFEYLNGEVAYHKIRLALAWMEKNKVLNAVS